MAIQVINGNVLQELPKLAEGSINCCVTSPPYWNLRDYGEEGQLGSEKLHDCLGWATGNPCGECFVCHMVEVGRGVKRVLRDDGVYWLNLGDSYSGSGKGPEGNINKGATHRSLNNKNVPTGIKPKDLCSIPWRVALALQSDGWYLRRDVVWAKGNPMPESVTDRPTTAHEYIFMFTKNERYWYDAEAVKEPLAASTVDDIERRKNPGIHDGETKQLGKSAGLGAGPRVNGNARQKRSVWTINPANFPGSHFAIFPYEIPHTCILAGCPPKVCSECGAPWKRVFKKIAEGTRQTGTKRALAMGHTATGPTAVDRAGEPMQKEMIGWQPTCDCNADTIPGTVLDPFSGAGTTGVVCRDLGLNYVGIELNSEYAAMSRDRIADPFYEQKLRMHQRVERENKEQQSLFED